MDYRICANCYYRNPFTGFCRFRNTSPTPFYWCPAWSEDGWMSMLFSTEEDENDNYEKFLKKLIEIP